MNRRGKLLLFDLALAALALAADQITKRLAVIFLKGQPPVDLIAGVLQLRYLENRGAAFGLFQNQKWLFVTGTVLVSAFLIWFFLRVPSNAKYRPVRLLGAFLLGGAIGNFLDRVRQGYVVDFIYFQLIDYPIFNVADIFVSMSCLAAVILLFFGPYKEGDFSFLRPGKKTEGGR